MTDYELRRWVVRGAVVVLVVVAWALCSGPAQAHTPAERVAWWEAWHQRVQVAGGLTPGLLGEAQAFQARHEPPPPGTVTVRASVSTGMDTAGGGTERWRPLVEAYFPPAAVNTMLCLMGYESGGDPQAVNPTSGAAGLFQVMPFWWDHYGGDRFDPDTNVRVARAIWDQQGYGAWSPWNRGRCR